MYEGLSILVLVCGIWEWDYGSGLLGFKDDISECEFFLWIEFKWVI